MPHGAAGRAYSLTVSVTEPVLSVRVISTGLAPRSMVTVTGSRRDGNRTILTFEVRDDHSAVQKAEFSLDGERWQNIYPRDGIADSRMERYELVLEGNQAARAVIIRVTDALNNVTSARGEAPAAPASR